MIKKKKLHYIVVSNRTNSHAISQSTARKNEETITCTYCKKAGHKWKECYKLAADNERKKKFGSKRDEPKYYEALIANDDEGCEEIDETIWILVSGATSHMTPCKSAIAARGCESTN